MGRANLFINDPHPGNIGVNIKNEKLNKGDWYLIDNGLGPIRAQLKESPRQGRGFKTAVFMFVKGTDAGLFDEHGSVYTRDILEPCDPPATA